MEYERDPATIYAKSFEIARQEADLSHLPEHLHSIAVRLIHACGMPDIADNLHASEDIIEKANGALASGVPVLVDCEMARAAITKRFLTAQNPILCTLNDQGVSEAALAKKTTRSAAAIDLWMPHLEGAIVAIGNAPTALFALLEALDRGAPKPVAIIGFPVGFVGAAESKAALQENPRGIAYMTLLGRRGGSALAGAAVNALSHMAQT